MLNIIPKPRLVEENEGVYIFKDEIISVKYDSEKINARQAVACVLKKISEEKEENDITFSFCDKLSEEEYILRVSEEGIEILYSAYGGAFYALTTLKQLINEKGEVPLCEISDKPLYAYRGLQLDESRHFFGKETVRKLLDFMALYKLNRFHWHLTDDQGWRIEIKKHPLLTEIGSKRVGSQLHNWKSTEMDSKVYDGYYTQDDIKEIIAYAKARNIEIVPEIDFPAHSAAAIASYNDLACRKIHAEVPNYFGGIIPEMSGNKDWNRCLCLGDDEVMSFVYDVLDEVSDLFPYELFHIGGDEAPVSEWKKCDKCQRRMKEEKLKNETELQGWFSNQLNAFLKSKGKTVIGWNEVLASKGLDTDVVAQYWTNTKDKRVKKHLKKGGKVILSKHKFFYFDMLHNYCSVKNTYNFTAKSVGIGYKYSDSVLGVEGENWTEWTDEERELFFKTSTRGLALSECAWSRSRNYKDFLRRYENTKPLLDEMGVAYGDNWVVLEKNKSKKAEFAKRLGLTLKDYDSEYEVQNFYGDK